MTRGSLAQLRAIVPVVDFTNSKFSDSENYWRHDAAHFRPEIGAQMIEEAFRRATVLP